MQDMQCCKHRLIPPFLILPFSHSPILPFSHSPIPSPSVIVIQFSKDSYTGSESDDVIVFDVVVTMGGIDKDVVLNFSTSDNTAIGQYTYNHILSQ